ncbi:MAG: SPFH domain-containing protein [Eggerthellaceae bacterium]|nr:SPFH domain-containing protein [Eggerthellaceae bacterium]
MPEIVSVIQFEGNPDQVVWKSPKEDFNSATQLIVDETHEAIVLVEGHAELFGTGRHTLDTQNYPFLQRIQRFATGGDTPFPCKVFFVKKNHSMDMTWGTRDVLTVEDPKLEIILHLMLHGNLTYVVDNSLKFVEKFTGFTRDFSPEDTVDKFRGIISTEVTDCVTKIVNVARIDYLDINAHLKEISQLLIEPLSRYFDDYGARLVYFNMETITSREDDLAEVQAAKSSARARVITARSEAEAREIQGYDWLSEKKADILQALASNDGTMGGMMGAGIGIMSVGTMGQELTSVIDDVFNPANANSANPFPAAGGGGAQPFNLAEDPASQPTAEAVQPAQHVNVQEFFTGAAPEGEGQPPSIPNDAITASGGTAAQPARQKSPAERLQEAKELLDMGLITQAEFDAKKQEVMSGI